MQKFLQIVISACMIQLTVFVGIVLTLVTIFLTQQYGSFSQFVFGNSPLFLGGAISLFFFGVGFGIDAFFPFHYHNDTKTAAAMILLAWGIAVSTSACIYFFAGIPDPAHISMYATAARVIDSYFESVSGFTTTTSSTLIDLSAVSRGVLLWRSMTCWLGGAGLAYIASFFLKKFLSTRHEALNAEAESPVLVTYEHEVDVRHSVTTFLLTYCTISGILFVLLFVSGYFFRSTAYHNQLNNVYDAMLHTLSTMGTGGFSDYSQNVLGLHSVVSEWIIAVFMLIAGTNFGLWYTLLFERKGRRFLRNRQLHVYLSIFLVSSAVVMLSLYSSYRDMSVWTMARQSVFMVASVLSTTGFANADVTRWPAFAIGMLFIVSLIGSCVGSTGGGIKIARVQVIFLYMKLKLLRKEHATGFRIDGVVYNLQAIRTVMLTAGIYYSIFIIGAVGIFVCSRVLYLPNGGIVHMSMVDAFAASLTNLGNIGIVIFAGHIHAGSGGAFYAFSNSAKLIMIGEMFIGRLGISTFLILFSMSRRVGLWSKE